MRLAEVWMDEYKEYYYTREPQIRHLEVGDISAQVAIREKLQCKSFKWFMENVAYDLLTKFPLPPRNKVWGECKNSKHRVCLDVRGASFGQPIGVSGCHHQLGNQVIYHHYINFNIQFNLLIFFPLQFLSFSDLTSKARFQAVNTVSYLIKT